MEKIETTTATPSAMRAVVFDGTLRFIKDYPVPEVPPGWALIHIIKAGICGTDIELIKGYKDFKGVLGHEFVGILKESEDPVWIGKHVVGEINAACGRCDWCARDLQRHCPNRTVLGILNLDGCMADYCILPVENLCEIPAVMSSARAICIEPLSAACEIIEQLHIQGTERVVVLGDGRLGILCAWVLSTLIPDVTLVGHHRKKLALANWRHLKTMLGPAKFGSLADIVVDATGSGNGLADAMSLCRPRGTIVLKSTVVSYGEVNLSSVVVNELTVVGSRCGQMKDGLQMLASYPDMPVERLITARYPIEQAKAAFEHAVQNIALKVLLDINKRPVYANTG